MLSEYCKQWCSGRLFQKLARKLEKPVCWRWRGWVAVLQVGWRKPSVTVRQSFNKS